MMSKSSRRAKYFRDKGYLAIDVYKKHRWWWQWKNLVYGFYLIFVSIMVFIGVLSTLDFLLDQIAANRDGQHSLLDTPTSIRCHF